MPKTKGKRSGDTSREGISFLPRTTVVGVGASAGGVKALKDFFELLPAEPGAAFVVVVHLDPEARSELPEILRARAKMPVRQVVSNMALETNTIYVISPDRQLHITDDEIAAVPFEEPRGHRAPIDVFFRSLANQHGDGFAIILTGAGSDGAVGVRAVKEHGGIILVQDPAEAEYPSMPRSAIATDVADFILPIREMAQRLPELIRAKEQVLAAPRAGEEVEYLRRILAHVRVRTGHDFSLYKRSTVLRRILRRMQVARRETLEEYFKYLHEHPEESQALLTDLLISVTAFFRDTKAFEALAKHVIAALVKDELHSPIRVWSAGCATGEEAYSIAMLLLEEAARHEFRPEIQVFGSDMDNRALAIAREGRYPSAIEADVSEERLGRFFTPDGDSYRVKRELRDVMLFANHSLLKDPPFSRLDLIACRNLLIYLDRDLQQQVLTTLQYGLKSDGFLFLGSSESADHPDGLFHTIDRDARIYQSTGRSSEKLPALPRLAGTGALERIASVAPTHLSARSSQNAHREALEVAAPPSILVDETYRVLHLSESAGRYLQPPGGPLSTDVTDLVRPAMRFELRAVLAKAFQNQEPVLSSAMFVQFNGHPNRVYLHVKPIITRDDDKEVKRALMVFVEGDVEKHVSSAEATVASDATNETVERLRHELEITQSRLRITREESESANEELRAANEELQSINEEYRSTAEELETSKEELQSINEELQTVNSELKLKFETVSRANSDLQNLMAAMDFGTLFLDSNLRIKRFTPRLTDLFSLTLADVGRPITDFTHQLDYDGLVSDARAVLQHLTPIERAITSRSGNWYLARYRPYRTTDDKIDGVVATFVDVSERRAMEGALRDSEAKLRQEMRLVEISRAPIFVWDFDDGILQWNRGCEELYGYTRDEALGKVKEKLLQTEVPGSSFQAIREALLKDGFWHGEVNQITKDGRSLTVESQIELLKDSGRRYVLESTRDITQSKALKARQQLLLGELTHRVKNTLAVVQAMVRQTWRNSPTGDDFIERLEGRIGALAEAHKLLVDSNWHGADLSALVTSQLRAYATENPPRLQMAGPPVTLTPEIATPFGLVLHELATNAVKHGALAAEKGTISLKWQVLERNSEHVLRIIWQEEGGPQVREPKKTSFGTRLIKQGIPGATVEYAFEPAGVRCIIEFPLRGTTEEDGEGV